MKTSLNSLIQFLRRSKKTLTLIVTVIAATLILSTAISMWLSRFYNLHFPSIGTILVVGAKAYGGDINGTETNQYVNWTTVYPGTSINRSFYIQSESNIPVTLELKTADWTFLDSYGNNVTQHLANYIERENAMNVTWNYSGAPLNPGEEIYVTLTLQTSSETSFVDYLIAYRVEAFNFVIIINTVT